MRLTWGAKFDLDLLCPQSRWRRFRCSRRTWLCVDAGAHAGVPGHVAGKKRVPLVSRPGTAPGSVESKKTTVGTSGTLLWPTLLTLCESMSASAHGGSSQASPQATPSMRAAGGVAGGGVRFAAMGDAGARTPRQPARVLRGYRVSCAGPLERAVARVFHKAGARFATDVFLSELKSGHAAVRRGGNCPRRRTSRYMDSR